MDDDNLKKDDEKLDNQEEDNNESNDDDSLDDKSLDELLEELKDDVSHIIESGEPEDAHGPLLKLSKLAQKRMKKITLIQSLILLPFSIILLFALTGVINWITYNSLFTIIIIFVLIGFFDTLINGLFKYFMYNAYLFSFGAIREAIILILFLLLYIFQDMIGIKIDGFWIMFLVVEVYVIIRAIIAFLISQILKKQMR